MRILAIAALAAALLLAGCTTPAPADDGDAADDMGDHAGGDMDDGMDNMSERAAAHGRIMAKARDVAPALDTAQEAWDAGYRPDSFCIPGMGVHWIHFGRFDTTLDPDAPEVVLFEPATNDTGPNGTNRFLGIEYVVITQGTEHNTTATVPEYDGIPLLGPMPGHFPGMPWHAELHVYLAEGAESTEAFDENAEGVTCPEGTTPPGA